MKLNGRVSVVTGAGSGIGRAVSIGLSAEGSRVVVVDIDGIKAELAAAEVCSEGGDARAVKADVGMKAFENIVFGPCTLRRTWGARRTVDHG